MTPTFKPDAVSGPANKKIRVILAEDQAMVLGALAALLEMEPDITVVARATTGRAALDAVVKFTPDVLVTDIEMPQMTGLEVAAAMRTSHPSIRTIILTTFARPGYLRRALDSGAHGYLLKDHPASELADAVRRVHRGLRVVDPTLATEAWNAELDPLTDRERQILQRAGDGHSSAEIASELHLSEGTVRNYLSEAIAKLGASNRIDAARIARTKGWL
jgi:two-component system response regulator DesR